MRLRTVAFSNLRRRKSRAAFLVAGLLVGIGTVVALLTLSQALTVQAQNNLETFGANIVVAPRTDGLSLTVRRGHAGRRLGRRPGHPAGRSGAHRRRSPTAGTSPSSRPSCSAPSASKDGQGLLMGVQPKNEFDLKKWWSVDGRPPRNGHELVAGSAAATALNLRTGASVSVDGRPFTVTGILRPTGSQDDNLLITDLSHRPGRAPQAGQGLDDPDRGALQQLPGGEDRRPARRRRCPGPRSRPCRTRSRTACTPSTSSAPSAGSSPA